MTNAMNTSVMSGNNSSVTMNRNSVVKKVIRGGNGHGSVYMKNRGSITSGLLVNQDPSRSSFTANSNSNMDAFLAKHNVD